MGMQERNVFQTFYKFCVCLAIAPIWNVEEERVENGKIAVFQTLIIAGANYAYLIYGDTVEYNIPKATSDVILYTLAKLSFMVLFSQFIYNRYNKSWGKLLRYSQNKPSNRCSSYMMATVIAQNVYFVVNMAIQAQVWLTTDAFRPLYALQVPILFTLYMNLAHASLIFNFLLIMYGDLKKINADIEPRDSDVDVTSHFRQIRIRYTNVLKSSEYFNKVFGVTILWQTFFTVNFLLESLNFLSLQHVGHIVQPKEYFNLCAMPIVPCVST